MRCSFSPLQMLSSPKHIQAMKLAVVLACVCLMSAAARGDSTVACYVDGSAQGLSLHPSVCTHVILASATIDNDSAFAFRPDADVSCTSPSALKRRNPGLKTLLGLEVSHSRLQMLTQKPGSLDNFTASTLKYLKEKNYDGLELMWVENPVSDERPRTTEALTGLLKELRERIKEDTGEGSSRLSVSLLDLRGDITTHNDTGTWAQYADFISLLPSSLEYEDSQIDRMLVFLQGFQLQKVLLALPAFGWKLSETGAVEKTAEQTQGPGLLMAKQVCQAIKSGETFKTLTQLESAQGLREEVSWLLRKGIGGVGVVALDAGNFADSQCLNLTESDKTILKSKLIAVSSRHHPGSRRRHHRHRHRHLHHRLHHQLELQQPRHDDSSLDSSSSGHCRHRHHQHGPGYHGHSHHGRSHIGHGHGRHGHGRHGHCGHGHHGYEGHALS